MSRVTALSFLALLAATSLVAQDKEKLCNDLQHRPMRVGQWAGYTWTGRSAASTMRLALVGTENRDGTPYYWYEIALNDESKGERGKTVIQLLVPGLALQASNVRGLIMKSGNEPALRMSDQMVQMTAGQVSKNFATDFSQKCEKMDVVGWEQVTVPAGSFRALHVQDTADQTDAWIVTNLYFGLLKVKLKDGSTMELSGRGADAKSSITETPRPMPF